MSFQCEKCNYLTLIWGSLQPAKSLPALALSTPTPNILNLVPAPRAPPPQYSKPSLHLWGC